MNVQNQLATRHGDVLFRQGDPSDRVLRVVSGEIEVVREIGGTAVLLGHVQEGEWLGEMAVIENRPRSATARVTADGAVESMSARRFLARVSTDPVLAHELILRLSVRLKRMGDRIAGGLAPSVHTCLAAERGIAATEYSSAENLTLSLAGKTDALRGQIGTDPIRVAELPFVVGRVPELGELDPPQHPNLLLRDRQPFRLSRDHFMVTCRSNRFVLSDLGSTLGTIVNGQAIGHHFMRDAAVLRPGANRVVAGGHGSPFDFIVTVG